MSRITSYNVCYTKLLRAFGKWYYSYHTRDMRLSLLMRNFEQPHSEIHRLADKLLGMAESGQIEEALQAYEESKNTTLAELMA